MNAKFGILALLFTTTLALVGCGKNTSDEPSQTGAESRTIALPADPTIDHLPLPDAFTKWKSDSVVCTTDAGGKMSRWEFTTEQTDRTLDGVILLYANDKLVFASHHRERDGVRLMRVYVIQPNGTKMFELITEKDNPTQDVARILQESRSAIAIALNDHGITIEDAATCKAR